MAATCRHSQLGDRRSGGGRRLRLAAAAGAGEAAAEVVEVGIETGEAEGAEDFVEQERGDEAVAAAGHEGVGDALKDLTALEAGWNIWPQRVRSLMTDPCGQGLTDYSPAARA